MLALLLGVVACSSGAATTPTTVGSTATSTSSTTTTASEPASVAVFEFPSAASIDGWLSVNDGVMGGVSTGALSWEDGALMFDGVLSLDNGGGFASAVSPTLTEPVTAWSTSDGISLDVVGDGSTYVVQVRTAGLPGGWIQRFPTRPGAEATVDLPWAAFESVDRFLNPIEPAEPLDRSTVDSVAIYLLDKQAGPFRLAIRAIR